MNINQIVIAGKLGKDPELKENKNGFSYVLMNLAVSDVYKGEKKTTWFNVKAFSKTADLCKQYLTKGSSVGFIGKVLVDEYEKDGKKNYYTWVMANQVIFGHKQKEETQSNEIPQSEDESVPF